MRRLSVLFLLLLSACTNTPATPAPQVSLQWTGEADIDLEIWSDTGYLCDAADFTGEERFAFRTYTETENLRGYSPADFSRGDYLVAASCWAASGPVSVTAKVVENGETISSNVLHENELWRIVRYRDGRFSLLDDTCAMPVTR